MPPDPHAADRLCRRVAHRAGPNFSVGFRLLPRAKRRAVYATYAFCRFVDDEVDEAAAAGGAERNLDEALDSWEAELARVYEGRPRAAVGVALARSLETFPVPRAAFHGLIEGCRLDLRKTRYADFEELLKYCGLVAGTISTMSLSIFGFEDRRAVVCGGHLATAFQLTNVLRDVGEDIRERNRIYVPGDEMERFGVLEDDLRAGRRTAAFRDFMAFQLERARSYYRRAEPLLRHIQRDARRCTWLMGRVYLDILDRIEASKFAVFGPRIGLSAASKCGRILTSLHTDLTRWQ